MRAVNCLLVILFLALVFSCAAPAPISVEIEPGMKAHWEALLRAHPLPGHAKISLIKNSEEGLGKTEAGGSLLRLRSYRPWEGLAHSAETAMKAAQGISSDGLLSRRLLSRPWAQRSLLWELPFELPTQSSVDISRLSPLEEILLPDVGLPAGADAAQAECAGIEPRLPLFPGDSGYPWMEEVRLSLEGPQPPASLLTWFESLEGALDNKEDAVIKLGAVGDVMLGLGMDAKVASGENGRRFVFRDTLPLLRATDILVGNLEAPLTTRGERAAKTYTFRTIPQVADALAECGFSFMSIANNHSFDFGMTGFTDTLVALEKSTLGWGGGGWTWEAAIKPWLMQAKGQSFHCFGLSAFPTERSGFDGAMVAPGPDRPGALWADAKTEAGIASGFSPESFDIVLIHAGNEYVPKPNVRQRELFRGLVDSGADLIIGSHPHVLQGIEAYKGKLIAYSLGNFVFADKGEPGLDSAMLSLGLFRGRAAMLWASPVRLTETTVSLAEDGATHAQLMRLCAQLAKEN